MILLLVVVLALAGLNTGEAQIVDGPFEGEQRDWVKNLCDTPSRPPRNRCDGSSLRQPRTDCHNRLPEPGTRFYVYNSTRRQCLPVVHRAGECLPGRRSRFDTLDECRVVCIPVCFQPSPQAQGKICFRNGSADVRSVWYYDRAKRGCRRTGWNGCHTTTNLFLSQEQCVRTCIRGDTVADTAPVNSRQRSSAQMERFCAMHRRVSPSRGTTTGSLTGEGAHTSDRQAAVRGKSIVPSNCELMECAQTSTSIEKELDFVSVFARRDCIEVILRLRCRANLLGIDAPSDSELNRLCGLAKEGIEHYWSRNITVNCPNPRTVPVRVRVHLVDHWLGWNAKDVVIEV